MWNASVGSALGAGGTRDGRFARRGRRLGGIGHRAPPGSPLYRSAAPIVPGPAAYRHRRKPIARPGGPGRTGWCACPTRLHRPRTGGPQPGEEPRWTRAREGQDRSGRPERIARSPASPACRCWSGCRGSPGTGRSAPARPARSSISSPMPARPASSASLPPPAGLAARPRPRDPRRPARDRAALGPRPHRAGGRLRGERRRRPGGPRRGAGAGPRRPRRRRPPVAAGQGA